MARKLPSDKDLLLMSQQFAIDACDIRKIMGHLETIVSESPEYALTLGCTQIIQALKYAENFLHRIAYEIDISFSMVDGPTYSAEQIKNLPL